MAGEGGGKESHRKTTRGRLNERKRGSGREGIKQEPAHCQVKWNSMCKRQLWEDDITSHLCPPLLYLLPPSPELTGVSARRQIAVRRLTKKSSAFHAPCHRHSSAAGRTWRRRGLQGCHRATDGWQTAWGMSLLLTHVCDNPSEVYHSAVLFS